MYGEIEVVGECHQQDMDYVANNMHAVIALPGCGEKYLSNLECFNDIQSIFVNLEWIGIIIPWFVDSLDIKTLEIKPGIEKSTLEVKDNYQVGKYNRSNAYSIYRSSSDKPETVRYGGTPDDEAVKSFVLAARNSGLKVAFYPFLLVDNENKDWRGEIKGDPGDIQSFYDSWYSPFIMHYAKILKDQIDMFYIGSELCGLTSIIDDRENGDSFFPFVNCLGDLALKVKASLGNGVKISYAANWSEYHSCAGGYRPLDKLWSNNSIDFVGIDYYMPLTDSDNEPTLQDIKRGFTSGEGYDYYKSSDDSIQKIDSPNNRWKDLEYWYSSDHWSWDSKKEKSEQTEWNPCEKLIVFSEFGFRSVALTTNKPYVCDEEIPNHSDGSTDFSIQMRAIRATLEYIEEKDFLAYGFCYGFDIRGHGWPKHYADGSSWEKGHFIDGKIVKGK